MDAPREFLRSPDAPPPSAAAQQRGRSACAALQKALREVEMDEPRVLVRSVTDCPPLRDRLPTAQRQSRVTHTQDV